ncbi:stage II sporulation protein M [Alkalibaculum sporogenes]|uniref:stage II sporulation protein M n=1 Tax=Alkalibaculum sporogenes TaxID=2655001 RepID=UPI00187B1BB5|nr:stage II sporulation protein M [Alkalibaculum sporogenes]
MNKGDITRFISINKRTFLILCTVFVIGIVLGTLCVKTLTDVQKTELINYLSNFFKVLGNTEDINKNRMFLQLLFDNIKVYVLILVLGMFSIGMLLIPTLVLIKGFILGFTIGFILDELYLMGLLFSLLVIFPQNILYIVGLIFSSLISILMSYNKYINKNKFSSSSYFKRNIHNILNYTLSLLVCYAITALGCAFEAYISPIFMIFFSNKLF